MVWLEIKHWKKGTNLELQPKFVGPYSVVQVFHNHTYLIHRSGQSSVQNECRLKPHTPCNVRPAAAEDRHNSMTSMEVDLFGDVDFFW